MAITQETLIQVQAWDDPGNLFTVAGINQWDRGIALAAEEAGTDFSSMYESPVETIYNATAYQIGADFGGIRENKFDFILAFHAKGTRDMPWRMVDSDFRKAFSFTKNSRIIVEHDGSRRYLDVRLAKTPTIKANYDPNGEQYALILYPLVGAYPRWKEDDAVSSFVATTDTTVSGTETHNLVLSNPSPIDVWVKWTLQGTAGIIWTIPDFSLGNDFFDRGVADAARKIVMPALINGENVKIDTDPETNDGQVNSSLDTEIYLRMNGKTFMYQISPGTNITVPVTVSKAPIGAGAQLRVPREWPRPWGME